MPINKTVNTMTVNELKKEKYKVNEALIAEVFANPVIRDLPKIASLYGMYSTFVIGQKDIYFVYGYNKEFIKHDVYYESRETVIPRTVALNAGYVNFENDFPILIGLDYNVAGLTEIQENYTYTAWKMMSAEMLRCRYEKYGLGVPQYCVWDQEGILELKKYIDVVDNQTIQNNAGKESYRKKEQEFLKDIAIWEWPITPTGRKPGYTAFLTASRYSAGLDSPRKAHDLYNRPENWEKAFHSLALNDSVIVLNLPTDEGKYIMHGLEQMKIPYRYVSRDEKVQKANMAETAMLNQLLKNEYTIQTSANDFIDFAVHKFDLGAVIYLSCQFTKTKFTKEEIAYGRTLFRGTTKHRKAAGEERPEVASYLFFVPHRFFELFKEFAMNREIRYGYPDIDWLETDYYDGVNLITEYSNMPLIDHWLHRIMHHRFSEHGVSISGDATGETRAYHQNQISVYVSRDPWQYQSGVLNANIIAATGNNDLTNKKIKIPADPLRWVPMCYSKRDLVKRHVMTDNLKT